MSDELNNRQQDEISGGDNYSEKIENQNAYEASISDDKPIETAFEQMDEQPVEKQMESALIQMDAQPVEKQKETAFVQSEEPPIEKQIESFSAHYGQNSEVVNNQYTYAKPKKKSKILGMLKLTAAALVFGIVAGAAFQGYQVIMNDDKAVEQDSDNDREVIETAQEPEDKDVIVPAKATSGDVVVSDVSDVVEKVMPSIVAINSNIITTTSDFFGRTYEQEGQASGSGIIIAQNDSKLLIVTNNHVVEGASSVKILFSDETTASAEIKGTDANADLAVVSVDLKDLTDETIEAIKVAKLGDSTVVEPGDMAIAIGNALGYGQSVTVGYISAVDREVNIDGYSMGLLQTDAAINPGNSGGALLNIQGQVIGINSVKYASTEVEGMGYAIPISSAVPMLNELMNREVVSSSQQGYLGIDASTAQEVTAEYAERFNMPVGIYVNDVIENSPAAKAGLESGNIITGVDDISVKTIDDLASILSYKKAGQIIELNIQVKENGKYTEKTLSVTLGNKQ